MAVQVKTSSNTPMDYRDVRCRDLLGAMGIPYKEVVLMAVRVEGNRQKKLVVVPNDKLFPTGQPHPTSFQIFPASSSAAAAAAPVEATETSQGSIVSHGVSVLDTLDPTQMIGGVIFAGLAVSHIVLHFACTGAGKMCMASLF